MDIQTQGDDRKPQQGTQDADAGSKPRSDAQQTRGLQGHSVKQGQGRTSGSKDPGSTTIERRSDDSGTGRCHSAKEDDRTGQGR